MRGVYLVKDNIFFVEAKDTRVHELLEELLTFDSGKFSIVIELRKIVFENFKETTERIMYGGIMFACEKDWGGIFVSKNHVSFEFTEGFMMNDPDGFLEGTGKKRRHLKISSISDISDKKVAFFVRQAVASTC